jgi:hypothetical protein
MTGIKRITGLDIMRPFTIKLILITLLITVYPIAVMAEVIIHDSVTIENEEATIKAETKGRFFPKGGQIVEFFVEGKSIGKTLSGGDGFAFKSFAPVKKGLFEIVAQYGDDRDSGVILAVRRNIRIVFIDIEGSFLTNPFARKSLETGRTAIKKIIKEYPVVYLQTGVTGTKLLRKWLRNNDFPASPVLPWQRGAILNYVKGKGIGIKALIGGQKVIESAKRYEIKTFIIDSLDDKARQKKWEGIAKEFTK